jgi:HEAT repeat protein
MRWISLKWLAPCVALLLAPAAWGGDGQTEKEKSLIAILRSDAAPPEKAITCKHLAVHGTVDAVPDLAKLLSDPQLSSWARIALEAIPGEESNAALREASTSLSGRLLIGMLNSLGVKKDAAAVDLLKTRLTDADAEVASAAAVALGHIANPAATEALLAALGNSDGPVRNAVAEACVLAAEKHVAQSAADAAAIFDRVRNAEVPLQRRLEATRGAILARGDEGLALLREQIHSPEKARFQLALSTTREFPGNKVDGALLEDLAKLPADRAGLLVEALADRRETVDLPAFLTAAGTGPKEIRISAIRALGRVGNDSCLPRLLQLASAEKDADLLQATQAALAQLPGEKVNPALVAELAKADNALKPMLLGLIARRRVPAVDEVMKSLDNKDKGVRNAALAALGATVELDRLPLLIDQVVKAEDEAHAAQALQALKTASVRMPDREGCAEALAQQLDKAPKGSRAALLDTLAAVGGTRALKAMADSAKGKDLQLQDLSTKHLGTWMTADAAPVLLDLATAGPDAYKLRALRGYIRIARQFVLPDEERLAMCKQALATAKQPAEQKMVLGILQRYPSVAGLKMAIDAEKTPALKEEARNVALAITAKLGAKAPEAKALLEKLDFGTAKVEILKATYGAGTTQKDVTEALKKHAAGLPLITLPGDNYNATFGGDPAPGVAKQLKVQYKLNDKTGEATFAENALIVLPVPK